MRVLPIGLLFLSLAVSAQPRHHWIFSKDGAYGYEVPTGTGRKYVVMVRPQPRGLDDSYHAMWIDGPITYQGYCLAPCNVVQVAQIGPGVMSGPQSIEPAKGSMLWAVFQDAISGQLK